MNAEALVGKVVGTCTLKRVIGQGSMGAVYLAEQSRPQRQVVVKVLLRVSELGPLRLNNFLANFRQEMDAAALLQHPNILPIYEYGEQDGLMYLVMPHVVGGTLQKVLKGQGRLPLSRVMNYLEQLAAALDYAHGRGVTHGDVKPANILVTANDRLLLTDFGLSKVMMEDKAAQARQFKMGMLDYSAPEQVMGKEASARSDLYSLGAILYHMVTGAVPFQGETLMEVAKQHLQVAPPSPRSMRTDLPVAAEQAMLRALEKRSANRYPHALDLVNTFRSALIAAHVRLETEDTPVSTSTSRPGSITQTGLVTRTGLLSPKWRTNMIPVASDDQTSSQLSSVSPTTAAVSTPSTGAYTTFGMQTQSSERVQEKVSKAPISEPGINPLTPLQNTPMFPSQNTPAFPVQDTSAFPLQNTGATDAMVASNDEQGNTGTVVKLTGPAKIVQVPVAGQPGRYVTGLLPVLPPTQQEAKEQPGGTGTKNRLPKRLKIIGLVLVALLVLGSGTFWLVRSRSNAVVKTGSGASVAGTPDVGATATARVTATVNANTILTDPLSQNIHNWPVTFSGSIIYQFKDGAYHIADNDNTKGAPAILPSVVLKGSFAYALTMEEIKGDDTSVNNEFGMILRANVQNKNGKEVTTFYTFEVLNKPGGEYQFWKYDNGQGSNANPWNELWHHGFGGEFHEGHGPKSINTFKVVANGKNFTLIVNGKQVGTVQDGSIGGGGVGMLVNLKGTEVAFSNLKLTYS
jgi:serine/threonine protein kinase